MIRLLIVDDHELIRKGVASILDNLDGFSVVAQATSGEDALVKAKEYQPDVVLMDVKMPGIGGIEATKRLKQQDDRIRVIALTSCEGELYPSRLLDAGALAYLTKNSHVEEMQTAIKKVMTGKSYVSQEIAQKLALRGATLGSDASSPFEVLSERELQIAMMIVRGEKPADIAKKLNINSKTINSYRYRIFEKFEIHSDVELVHFAIKHKMFDVDTLE